MSRLIHVGEGCTRNPEQAGASSDRTAHQAIAIVWHTIEVIPQAEIKGQTRSHLPFIFEECSPLILMVVPEFVTDVRICDVLRIFGIGNHEAFTYARNRTVDIREYVARRHLVCSLKA